MVKNIFKNLRMSKVTGGDVDKAFTDFVIRAGSESYDCHRVILASYSPVFRRMLQCDMKEKSTGMVTIEDTKPDVIKAMLNFIYTGEIDRSASDEAIEDLFIFADMYFIEDLKKACDEILANPTIEAASNSK